MNPIKIVISVLAVALLGFVGVGLALPGEWTAERSRVFGVEAPQLFVHLTSAEAWSGWTPMPFVEGEVTGPTEGPGSTLSWDDPQWGDGVWMLTEWDADRRVAYRVEVEEGAIVTFGEVTLEPHPDGTLLTWRERGDFGWNPLLKWMAIGMERMQGDELSKSLDTLEGLVAAAAREPTPAPTP